MNLASTYREKQEMLMDSLESTALASTVPFNSDFANDPRLCLTCVAFLPAEIASAAESAVIRELRHTGPAHYSYPSPSLHLTVQNVRTISDPPKFNDADIARIVQCFKLELANCASLEFEIDGLLRLPTSIALRAYCDESMLQLTRTLRRALNAMGMPDDKEYISDDVVFGNITVCRFGSAPDAAFLEAVNNIPRFTAKFEATELALISTNAVCHPSKTTVFERFPLSRS